MKVTSASISRLFETLKQLMIYHVKLLNDPQVLFVSKLITYTRLRQNQEFTKYVHNMQLGLISKKRAIFKQILSKFHLVCIQFIYL